MGDGSTQQLSVERNLSTSQQTQSVFIPEQLFHLFGDRQLFGDDLGTQSVYNQCTISGQFFSSFFGGAQQRHEKCFAIWLKSSDK